MPSKILEFQRIIAVLRNQFISSKSREKIFVCLLFITTVRDSHSLNLRGPGRCMVRHGSHWLLVFFEYLLKSLVGHVLPPLSECVSGDVFICLFIGIRVPLGKNYGTKYTVLYIWIVPDKFGISRSIRGSCMFVFCSFSF